MCLFGEGLDGWKAEGPGYTGLEKKATYLPVLRAHSCDNSSTSGVMTLIYSGQAEPGDLIASQRSHPSTLQWHSSPRTWSPRDTRAGGLERWLTEVHSH